MKNTKGMRIQKTRPKLTRQVSLPGGQSRLREMILYISKRCAAAERMGLTKLNKILWKADFESYAERQMPVTGRAYQKLDKGPAPKEMRPLLNEMLKIGIIRLEQTDFGDGIVEQRPIAMAKPNLINFSEDDLKYVDAAISYYWDKTGTETSDDSHGIAWKSRDILAPMYYELSYLSDDQVSPRQRAEILSELKRRKRAARPN